MPSFQEFETHVNLRALKKKKIKNRIRKLSGNGILGGQSLWTFAVLALSLLLTLTAYRKAFDNEFVDWDDFTYVVNNNLVRAGNHGVIKNIFSTPVSSNYHPLTILSLRLNNNKCEDCQHGISPKPFVEWNVFLHLFNTLLVFFLILKLGGGQIFPAFFVSAIFGIHPMHVESVAWISERKDVLYVFFFLSGLISYLEFKKGGKYRIIFYFLTFFLFVSSCLSKAVAVVFPLVLLLIDFLIEPIFDGKNFIQVLKEIIRPKRLLLLLPFFMVLIFIGLLAYNLQNGQNFFGLMHIEKNLPDVVNTIRKLSLFERFGIASFGIVSYVINFLVPTGLSAIYPYPSVEEMRSMEFILKMAGSFIITIFVAALLIMRIKKTKLWFFGAGFFFLTVVLVLQFISVGIAIKADRYTYLPYIGLAFIPAMLITKNLTGTLRKVMFFISVVFIVVFWFITSKQVDIWQNTETLWSDVINKYPEAETPRASRGKFYVRQALKAGNKELKQYFEEKAFADFMVAVKVKTKNTDVYEGVGFLLAERGDFTNALNYFNMALIADPENGSAYFNRALVYTSLKKPENALEDYSKALKYWPEKTKEIITNRSNILLDAGRFSEVISDLDYLITVEPANPDHYFNRATARLVTGNIEGAIEDLVQVLRLNPSDKEAAVLLKKISGK